MGRINILHFSIPKVIVNLCKYTCGAAVDVTKEWEAAHLAAAAAVPAVIAFVEACCCTVAAAAAAPIATAAAPSCTTVQLAKKMGIRF